MGSFGGGLETLGYEFDPNSIVHAIALINKNIEGVENTTEKGAASMKRDWESVLGVLTKITDKGQNAADSHIRSLERQAAAIGKSGIDKLNAQMEQAIKNYGYSEAAIKKITSAYEKMTEAQEKGAQGFSAGTRAGMGARDLFEGRNAYGAVEFGKGLGELKGAPAVLGAVAAAFTAAAFAGYELVKSTAEEARELNNLSIRTGLTVEQAENLSIQAKIAGVDINSLERSAVQLSKGLEDASGAGKQQSAVLRDMGISTLQASGQQKEMGEVLTEVLQKLSQIPDTAKRLYEAQLLLGRGAKELQPMITDLGTLKETADQLSQSLASGANEELLKAARQISTMDEAWSVFKKNLASKIAPIIIPVVTAISNDLAGHPERDQANTAALNSVTPRGYARAGRDLDLPGLSYAPSAASTSALTAGVQSDLQGSAAAEATRQRLLRQSDVSPEAIQAQITEKKQQIDRDLATLNQKGAQDSKVYLDANKDLNKALGEQLALQQKLKALQAEPGYGTAFEGFAVKGQQSPLVKQLEENQRSADELRKQYPGHAQAIGQQEYLNIDAILKEFTDKAAIALQKGAEKAAEELVKMAEERSSIENSINQQNMKQLAEAAKSGMFSTGVPGEGIQIPLTPGMGTPPGPSSRQQSEMTKDMLAQESKRIELMAGPGGELSAARQILELKKQALSIDEGQAELEAGAITNQMEREKKIFDIRLEYSRQVYDAEAQYQDKLLERQKQVAETAAGLYHTLFTDPKKFTPQLEKTLKEAALKPVTEGLGNLTAQAIFGGNRTGTLQDVRSTNGAMHVFVTNLGGGGSGPAPINLSGGYSGGRTISLPFPGGGAFSIPSFGPSSSSTISLPYFGASGPLFGGGTTSSPSFGAAGPISSGSTGGGGGFSLPSLFGGFGGGNPASMIGPGGTAPFIGNGGSNGPGVLSKGIGGALGPLKGALGGGGGSGSGGNFGVLGAANGGPLGQQGGPFAGFGPGSAGGFGTGSGPMGLSSGVGGSAGAALGGTGLAIAMNGLTGRNEGTGKGVAEGAIGGAMVGMQYGGPVGAAIGAAVGAGIGVGEMLAGVMSPWAKASMYAKQLYGITINDNMQNQIVNIAKGSFGGNIQLAVRSPQVRQMLGLYAAGTGQANAKALMDSTPHGAGLSQQNGGLFQDTSYLYGQSYKYSSSLPTLGANNTTQTYSSPTAYAGSQAPVNLSLSIDGKNAGDFMAGNVVTPDFVQDQWNSSQMSSNGRVSNSALLQEPGLITA